MNQLKLIDGRFSKSDASKLLKDLIKTKISFHEDRIKTIHESEEEIKHSEKRIRALEENLRMLLAHIGKAKADSIDIEADIRIF